MAQKTASRPIDLPVVESCVRQVKSQGQSKESAIKICKEKLRQAGRIKKQDDGKWVQVNPQGGGNERSRQRRRSR